MKTLRLGLIGGNITESRSPALQIICGLSIGRNVSYDLLVPTEQDLSFDAMLARCQHAGFDGVNVTYPYKEGVLKHVAAGAAVVAALGASNTVVFAGGQGKAYNTDHTGFIAAYRAKFGNTPPGRVLLIGTGGVGRAIAFALADLAASEILLHDADGAKAESLCTALAAYTTMPATVVSASMLENLSNLDGVINGTPLGMVGHEGSPLPAHAQGKPRWAFDAVYTPEHTRFRTQVQGMGAAFLSGYELYFHQGVQGFRLFSGADADVDFVRRTLNSKV